MALSFNQASRRRKLIYAGIIVLLFSGMLVQRRQWVEPAARTHDLRETDIGEVDLGGSFARFALTSFRGPLICGLWWEAIERQKRHEWDQLEVLLRSLTKLQPHFREPWKYQGWNLAFNVSVEFDRVQDKYFYINEGIQWLTEGERINRSHVYDPSNPSQKKEVGDPDLRWSIGFYILDKMTVSDEAATFKCYLHLSSIKPDTWNPLQFAQNPERLREFKAAYPQLVRRVRELKHIPEGAEDQLDRELRQFLTPLYESYRAKQFPSRYVWAETKDEERDPRAGKPFPVWPETRVPANPEVEEHQHSYEIARRWFEFSIEPLPAPNKDVDDSSSRSFRLYRLPQGMVSLIFRKQPALAKSSHAQNLGKEGWFDESRRAWAEAYVLWKAFGETTGLEVPQETFDDWQKRYARYQEKFPSEAAMFVEPPKYDRTEEDLKDYLAARRLAKLMNERHMAHYTHWKVYSEKGQTPEAIAARRHIYNASTRYLADMSLAMDEYRKGLAAWRGLLVEDRKPDYARDFGCMLALLPTGQVPICMQFTPIEFVKQSEFGADRQAQEEALESQDGFLRLRAKVESPGWLKAGTALWELPRQLGPRALSPGLPTTPLIGLPDPNSPLAIDWVEDFLEVREGPIDRYLDPMLILSRGFRAERRGPQRMLNAEGMPAPTRPSEPPPGQTAPVSVGGSDRR
jgi:hypothetical protein